MAMYALATVPLITKITANGCKQICYADDAASGRKLILIRTWWQQIIDIGPKYGYHPNQSKSWLIVKPKHLNQAQHLFNDTGIRITTEGHHYLGTALGESNSLRQLPHSKVESWKQEIERLSLIAETQPLAAHAAFTHWVIVRWTYISRCNGHLSQFISSLKNTNDSQFILAITKRPPTLNLMRSLFAFLTCLGGLGIIEPASLDKEYKNLPRVSQPLITRVVQQSHELVDVCEQQQSIKYSVKHLKEQETKLDAETLTSKFSNDLKCTVDLSSQN